MQDRSAQSLDDSDFRSRPPEDRYEVTLEGSRVTIRPLRSQVLDGKTIGGTLTTTNPEYERFQLEDGFAGGHFLVQGADAELTFYGSGRPVVASERGTLVAR